MVLMLVLRRQRQAAQDVADASIGIATVVQDTAVFILVMVAEEACRGRVVVIRCDEKWGEDAWVRRPHAGLEEGRGVGVELRFERERLSCHGHSGR